MVRAGGSPSEQGLTLSVLIAVVVLLSSTSIMGHRSDPPIRGSDEASAVSLLSEHPSRPIQQHATLGTSTTLALPPFGSLLGPISTLDLVNNTEFPGNYLPPVAKDGTSMAYDPSNGNLYIANVISNNVEVLNLSSGTIGGWIPVGSFPSDIVYDPINEDLYTANTLSANVSVINATSGKVTLNIPLGLNNYTDRPTSIAVDTRADTLFVANLDGYVREISGTNNTLVHSIWIAGTGGYGIEYSTATYDSSNDYVYVGVSPCEGCGWGNFLSVINASAHSVVGMISLETQAPFAGGYLPSGTYDPNNHEIYVANRSSLLAFRGLNLVGSVPAGDYVSAGSGPQQIAWDASNDYIYVARSSGGGFSEIDGANNSLVGTLSAPTPQDRAVIGGIPGPNGTLLALTSAGLIVLAEATGRTIRTISLEYDPGQLSYDQPTGRLYLTNGQEGGFGVGSRWLPRVSYDSADNLTFVDAAARSVAGALPFPFASDYFGGLAVDPTHQTVAVESMGNGNLTIFNVSSGMVSASIRVNQTSSGDVAYESATHEFLFALGGPGFLTVSAASGTVSGFALAPSHYYATGIAYDPHVGDIYVSTTTLGSPTYRHDLLVYNGSNDTLVGSLALGNELALSKVAYDPVNQYIYEINSPVWDGTGWNGSSSVDVVSGTRVLAHIPVSVNLSNLGVNPVTGDVYVASNSSDQLLLIRNISLLGNLSVGVGPEDVAFSSDGTAFVTNYWSGTLTILPLATGLVFPVTFSEQGLPVGTLWSMTLNGETEVSRTSRIAFTLENGTYSFEITPPAGYAARPAGGTLQVNGAGLSRMIAFILVSAFPVTFSETGLPPGTSWSVNLSGIFRASTVSSIVFAEPNGTYAYTLGRVPGWTTSSFTGVVGEAGAASSATVAWTRVTYAVRFTGTGLPSTTPWSVTFNGSTASWNPGGICAPPGPYCDEVGFRVANGTYEYTIGPVANYKATPSGGAMTVGGQNVSAAIVFTSSSSMIPGFPTAEGYAVLGGITAVMVAAGAVAVLWNHRRRTLHRPPRAPPPPPSGGPPAQL